MIAFSQRFRLRLPAASCLSALFGIAFAFAQEPTVSTNGQTDRAAAAEGEDAPPPPPPPKTEFMLLAERLTDVKIPKTKVDASLIKEGISTKAAGLTDRSGKPLVDITVDPMTFPTYSITSGDRLYNIAHQHYGSGHYGEFLAAYNDIDPSKLRVGQEIRLPSIDEAFNAAGLYPLMSEECGMVLKARSDFQEMEPTLRTMAGKPISAETKERLLECRKLVLEAMHALGREKVGVREAPQSVQVQLRSCAENLNRLAKGRYATKHIARVHQRFGYSVSYAIVWARNGYE